jgi:UDP-N-acetyl-D-glucosamine dehydrogenase
VVGGVTPRCTEAAVAFYGSFLETIVPVSSTRVAEMSKLLENIFRCVNIALVNELLMLSDRMDIDIWEVVDAAKTKPFGFMPFYPGPGLGGHCIPIDPFYLSWKAREYDFHTEFIELAGKTNEGMPYHVVERIAKALNSRQKPLSGSTVLVLGVAYKSDIDDLRESPAIKVVSLLRSRGATVVYHDPYVDEFVVDGVAVERVELSRQACERCDITVVITSHANVDYEMVVSSADLILDTRNVLKGHTADHIIRL